MQQFIIPRLFLQQIQPSRRSLSDSMAEKPAILTQYIIIYTIQNTCFMIISVYIIELEQRYL